MSRPKPSSRENGRLSRGPKSQAGKDISKMNALRHGIFAGDAVLYNVPPDQDVVLETEKATLSLRPQNDREDALIQKMVLARIRARRLLEVERLIIAELAKQQPPGPLADREIAALAQFASEGRAYDTLLRLESRHKRQFAQAHAELLQLRSKESLSKLQKMTDRT